MTISDQVKGQESRKVVISCARGTTLCIYLYLSINEERNVSSFKVDVERTDESTEKKRKCRVY